MKKILIIDDEKSIRSMLMQLFEKNNYEVTLARDGQQGIKLYKENRPDIIITDLIMPEKEGLETIKELKALNPDVKIIAMSGGGTVDPGTYLDLAKRMGALCTFSKPIDNKLLVSTVKELIAKKV